jgi:hypothetical protein
MRLFVGRPRFTRSVAIVTYYVPLWLVCWALLAWAFSRKTEAERYRDFQREIAAWDSRAAADSLKLAALDAAIQDSAEAAVDRLTPDLVREQHARYGQIIFAPPAMLTEQAKTRDHMAWSAREAQKRRNALDNWLNETSEGRDTLGVRHR